MLHISVVFDHDPESRAQQMFFAAFVFDVTTDSSKHEKWNTIFDSVAI